MKIKSIITIITISLLYSCGSKKGAISQEGMIKEINSYAQTVDNNGNLKKEITEGALTDTEGFNDIGTFKYTVHFDTKTNQLYKIENIETTDRTVSEYYYFKDENLISILAVSGHTTKKIFLKKGRVISEENTTSEDQQLLIEKANRFQKAFKKSH